jgi:hypothetical protein
MNRKLIPYFAALTVLVLMAGCKGDTGPAGPSLGGSMSGFVNLFQSDGSQDANPSGVTVSIQGASLSTTTDSTGKWTINGLTTGTYTVTYTKPGYGMTEQPDVQFAGGGTDYLGTIIMAQPPNFTVKLDSAELTSVNNGSIEGWYKINTAQEEECVLIAVGMDSNVSASDPTKYVFSEINGLSNFLSPDTNEQLFGISGPSLQVAGFKSGEYAYVVVYPLCFDYGGSDYSSYVDPATGRTAYTSLGTPSAVIRVVVP